MQKRVVAKEAKSFQDGYYHNSHNSITKESYVKFIRSTAVL